jgi:hypothetical protein
VAHVTPIMLWQQAAERAQALESELFQTNLAYVRDEGPPPTAEQQQEVEDARKLAEHLFEQAKIDLGMTLPA